MPLWAGRGATSLAPQVIDLANQRSMKQLEWSSCTVLAAFRDLIGSGWQPADGDLHANLLVSGDGRNSRSF
jgi:hypothetical protein